MDVRSIGATLFALALFGGAAGFTPAGAARSAGPAARTDAQANPVSTALTAAWRSARRNLQESAELATPELLAFKPIDSVRTFGAILTHVAGANYEFCAAARGESAPYAEAAFEDKVTDKAGIVRVLGESLEYCDAAFAAATDRSLAEAVPQPFGGGQGPRAAPLVGNISHLNEHYGNLVTYFRLKGIVPPSSRR